MKKSVLGSILSAGFMIALLALSGCDPNPVTNTHVQRADSFMENGEMEKAFKEYDVAIEIHRDNVEFASGTPFPGDLRLEAKKLVEAYYKAGLAYEKAGKTEMAMKMFEGAAQDMYKMKNGDITRIDSQYCIDARKKLDALKTGSASASKSNDATREQITVSDSATSTSSENPFGSAEKKLDMEVGSSTADADRMIFNN
jgi:tetratricopeptide (TPR) repeat protein